jgi:hypothetical protein
VRTLGIASRAHVALRESTGYDMRGLELPGDPSGVVALIADEFDRPNMTAHTQRRTAGPVTGEQRTLDVARQILRGTDLVIQNQDDCEWDAYGAAGYGRQVSRF